MDSQDGDGTTRKLVEDAALSEEVNGTPEAAAEYGIADDWRSESHKEDENENENENDDDDDEEEHEHPGEVSVGKMLWTFLTT